MALGSYLEPSRGKSFVHQTNNMLGVSILKMMPATGKTFVQQVGRTGPVGFWVNHIVLAAVACRYNCDITIIQSMSDDTNALIPLSGKNLALSLTDEHYNETTQWRHHNAPGDVAPLFFGSKMFRTLHDH